MSIEGVRNLHGCIIPPLGGGRHYNSTEDAQRAMHCEVRVKTGREEIPGKPGFFRDTTELVHRPGEGTYDGAKCAAVKCPNLQECAAKAEPIAAE